MLLQIVFITLPAFILSQIVINSQSKDFCPDSVSVDGRLPRLQIRSVLVRCPNKGEFHVVKTGADNRQNLSLIRTQDLLEFFGYDTDEPLLHSEVTSCRRKLVVTIQMTNCGRTKTDEEFVLIDQVYDPIWKERVRLLNPMVFKIKQYQVEQAFGLNIQHIVNADATEEVLNKNNKSFYACKTSGISPTCGYSYYHDEVIPFSEGFCCSCDSYVNVQRQPNSFGIPPLSPIAFTTREGSIPQGFQKKKGVQERKRKRKTKRSLKDALDEIYLNFASKIKSYMNPPNRRIEDVVPAPQLPREYRISRGLFRLSPKYYNIPPMQPARGFKANILKSADLKNTDPWAISITENPPCHFLPRGYLKNHTCSSGGAFNKILPNLSPVKRKIRSWEWEPEVLDQLSEGENNNEELNECFIKKVQNTSDADWLNNIVNPYEDLGIKCPKRNKCTVRTTKQGTTVKHHKRNSAKLIQKKVERRHVVTALKKNENFIKKIQNTTDAEWLNKLVNPYEDNGKNCRRKTPNITQRVDSKKCIGKKVSKRQISASGTQVRGGQSCVDRYTPSYADPETYHESAHCLRFSELWYNVYRLKMPFVSHKTDFKLFEKHTFEGGNNHWEDLSQGMHIQLGTFMKHVVDHEDDPTLVFTYTPLSDITKKEFCLDPMLTTLLVPRPVAKSKEHLYPQVRGGPSEYLLIRSEDISFDGEQCDKAGVSYRAFAKQPSRCDHSRGSCLKNQPLALWKHDKEAQLQKKAGLYFLQNYATISDEPVKYHKEIGDFLALDYVGSYQSVVEVEVPIDKNGLVRVESSAQISEIYIDSTCEHQTRLTLLVTNTGLTSSAFFPRLKGCPPEIPQVWTENEGPLVYIAPMKVHRYRLSLYGKLPVTRFHCSIEVLNKRRELVATRRIRIQIFDRCLCMWHCLCACSGSIDGLKCNHMSVEHYHAAGFSGALPVDTEDPNSESEERFPIVFKVKDFIHYVLNVYLILLLLGFLKFLLGMIFVSVSNYGIWVLFETEAKSMKKYRESYWTFTHLVRDAQSYPVSPACRTRDIQILSRASQGFVNIFFFCIFPGVVLLKLPRACCEMFCLSIAMVKVELWKLEWARGCFQFTFCKILSRCCRRIRRAWRKNFWLPICCFINPFFLYSLCKPKPPCSHDSKQSLGSTGRICRLHKLPMKEKKEKNGTIQFYPCLIQPQFDFKSGKPHEPMKRNVTWKGVDSQKGGKYIFIDESNIGPSVNLVVKTSDYPDLDRKTIKYVAKKVKKGFNSVINEVIRTYKLQKNRIDLTMKINDVEEMKNKRLKNLISSVTKSVLHDIVKRRYGIEKLSDKEAIIRKKVPVKPIAEQVMILTEQSIKDLVKRKFAGAKIPAKVNTIDNNQARYNIQCTTNDKFKYSTPKKRRKIECRKTGVPNPKKARFTR